MSLKQLIEQLIQNNKGIEKVEHDLAIFREYQKLPFWKQRQYEELGLSKEESLERYLGEQQEEKSKEELKKQKEAIEERRHIEQLSKQREELKSQIKDIVRNYLSGYLLDRQVKMKKLDSLRKLDEFLDREDRRNQDTLQILKRGRD